MTDTIKPPPLEPMEAQGCWDDPVVDFAGYKARAGRTPWREEKNRCEHKSVIYSQTERRIWCGDCNNPVDPFDAFATIVRHFEEMTRAIRREYAKAREGSQAVIIRRGAKEIDRTWGHKMAPCCPHCRRGLLPHDFADGTASSMSIEFEVVQRRKALKADPGRDGGGDE